MKQGFFVVGQFSGVVHAFHQLVNWICLFLTGRNQMCTINGHLSSSRSINLIRVLCGCMLANADSKPFLII